MFFPCKMEPNTWLIKITNNEPHDCKHMSNYVGDLLITFETPDAIVRMLEDKHMFCIGL